MVVLNKNSYKNTTVHLGSQHMLMSFLLLPAKVDVLFLVGIVRKLNIFPYPLNL